MGICTRDEHAQKSVMISSEHVCSLASFSRRNYLLKKLFLKNGFFLCCETENRKIHTNKIMQKGCSPDRQVTASNSSFSVMPNINPKPSISCANNFLLFIYFINKTIICPRSKLNEIMRLLNRLIPKQKSTHLTRNINNAKKKIPFNDGL